ncbi:hypothetical protein BD310DRAFT_927399 [Dichomitus squalens]|uniref:Uncharacterized protein n=1 Tax=Dichomitus squalens TaxID=114155 RepID=A0A4Q9PUR1_9APHY|nr:hypothetical protein BD310DRAFT_927399 [Dichomitus squalens]
MHARCTELRNACADRRRREETSTMRWSWCLAPVSIQFLCLFVRILPHGRQSLEICRAPGLGCCVEVSTGRDIDGNLVCPGLASRRRVTTGIRMLSRCRIFWRGGSQVHIACLGLGISNSLRLGTFKVLLPPQMPLHPTALEGMLLSFCPAFLRPVRSRPGLRKPQAPRWMDIRLSRSVHHPRVSTFVKVQAGVGRTNRFRDPGPGRKRGVLSFV